jgi:broad specificity phosphatase PhoE
VNTVFHLIRHGEVDNPQKIIYGRTSISLSNKGKLQLYRLAVDLKRKNINPDIIISSDLRRNIQSAEEILKVFPNTPFIYTEDLEEVDLGELTGKKLEYQHSIGDIYNAGECKDMNIERPQSIINRQLQVIINACKNYPGKTIFIVGHKQPLEFLMWRLNNLPTDRVASITDIEKEYLLKKGQAWKIVLDENLRAKNLLL